MSGALPIDDSDETHVARIDAGQDNTHPFWVTAQERGRAEPLVWRFKNQEAASFFMHTSLLTKKSWRDKLTSVALEVVTFKQVVRPLHEGGCRVTRRNATCLNFWSAFFYSPTTGGAK